MSRLGRTALVLPVPAVDPVLAEVAARYPATVRRGLPAHLTVLYPFVPSDRLDRATGRDCARIARRTAPIPMRFTRCRMRGDMAYLRPEPVAPVDALLRAARAGWPDLAPYGGRFPDAPAHVTLALEAPPSDHADILRLVDPLLPIETTVDELVLVASGEDGWTVHERWPLAGGGAGRTV